MDTTFSPRTEAAFVYARGADQRWERSWNAPSGTDQAEGHFYHFEANFWRAIGRGEVFDSAFTALDTMWREYAARNNARVAAAPKVHSGPRTGQSGIAHRWVSPDKAQQKLPHLRTLVEALPNA